MSCVWAIPAQVFQLEPLKVTQLEELIDRALADKERGLGNYKVQMDFDARTHLAKLADESQAACQHLVRVDSSGMSGVRDGQKLSASQSLSCPKRIRPTVA